MGFPECVLVCAQRLLIRELENIWIWSFDVTRWWNFQNLATGKWSKRWVSKIFLSKVWPASAFENKCGLKTLYFDMVCSSSFSIFWLWLFSMWKYRPDLNILNVVVLARPNYSLPTRFLVSGRPRYWAVLCRDPNICFELFIAELLMRASSSQFCHFFAQLQPFIRSKKSKNILEMLCNIVKKRSWKWIMWQVMHSVKIRRSLLLDRFSKI